MKSRHVFDYLQSLPRETQLNLYGEESRGKFVCKAVLQRLNEMEQQIVLRLTSCGGTFGSQFVHSWTKSPWKFKTKRLKKLAILQPSNDDDDDDDNKNDDKKEKTKGSSGGSKIQLTMEFYKGIKASLTSLETTPWKPLTPAQVSYLKEEAAKKEKKWNDPPTLEALERHTETQWDCVLHFLVGTPQSKDPPPAVVHFLLKTGLMQADPEYQGRDKDDAPLVITNKGYDFMLQDTHVQVWHFVLQYLEALQNHPRVDQLRKEALLFLISLSYGRVGDGYLASSLSKDGRTLMKDLALFGLLYVVKLGGTTAFYPTRVSVNLVASSNSTTSGSNSGAGGEGLTAVSTAVPTSSSSLQIVVQTNFQVAAYTSSKLHVSMLGLFCDVRSIRQLPNVVFMEMSRDSVKAAFALGIHAYQIIRFLQKHAHPKMKAIGGNSTNNSSSNAAPQVPPNVVDQIWLWDRELTRVQFHQVYAHQCHGMAEFEAVVDYTKQHGAYGWSSTTNTTVLIKFEKAPEVMNFVREWRTSSGGGSGGGGGGRPGAVQRHSSYS